MDVTGGVFGRVGACKVTEKIHLEARRQRGKLWHRHFFDQRDQVVYGKFLCEVHRTFGARCFEQGEHALNANAVDDANEPARFEVAQEQHDCTHFQAIHELDRSTCIERIHQRHECVHVSLLYDRGNRAHGSAGKNVQNFFVFDMA